MSNYLVLRRPTLLLTCLLAGLSLGLYGQRYDGASAHISRLSLNDGLPDRTVHTLVRDTAGIMWAGSGNRIVRYDGYQFEVMEGIEEEFRGDFTLGPTGLIYAPHPDYPDSVEIFDPYHLVSFGLRVTVDGEGTARLIPQKPTCRLSFWTDRAIYQINFPQAGRRTAAAPRATYTQLHAIASPLRKTDEIIHADARSYTVWRERGVTIVTNHESFNIPFPQGNAVRVVYRSVDGAIWCLTDDVVYRAGRDAAVFSPLPETVLPKRRYNFLNSDRAGNLILGYKDRLSRRMLYWQMVTPSGTFDLSWLLKTEDRMINASGSDFTKAIDLATYGGINLLDFGTTDARGFKRLMYEPDVPKGKFGHVMRGFTTDDFGTTYANKDSGTDAWYCIKPGASKVDTMPILDEAGRGIDQHGCGTNMINFRGYVYGHSCHRSRSLTKAHLYRFDPGDQSWKVFYLPTKDQVIRYLVPDPRAGCVYLPTENTAPGMGGHIYKFDVDAETITKMAILGGEPHLKGYPRAALLDSVNNVLWVGTLEALYKFDLATQHLHRYDLDEHDHTRILAMHLLPDKTLMLGIYGKGLYHFDPASESLTRRGGTHRMGQTDANTPFFSLPNNSVAGIADDGSGNLILTTYDGLVYIEDGMSTTFTVRDGLADDEFNTSSLHYDELSERWYAGGINGFVSFKRQDILRRSSRYVPTVLRYRRLDENSLQEETINLVPANTDPLTIAPSVAYFSIEFAVPDYRPGKEITYQTQLVGLDPAWRVPTTATSVRYTRLPPGKYEFHLRATDSRGNITDDIKPITIKVLAPWYKQPWFYLLVLFGMATLIAVVVRSRFSRLRERYEADRKVQTLELRTLRQQMNPHFISNAMNAIREFVYQKDPEKAAGYLTDFSRLMRLFLEASRSPMMSVAREVDLINHYVRLEQLRFPGQFECVVHVDDQIDPEMDEVPSFLLQPVVENAINHGLRPLPQGGQLSITFRLDEHDDDVLIVEVADNGVGRAATAKRTKDQQHVSRASQIIKDREALLADDIGVHFTMQTTDLYPGADLPGTKVTITTATRPIA